MSNRIVARPNNQSSPTMNWVIVWLTFFIAIVTSFSSPFFARPLTGSKDNKHQSHWPCCVAELFTVVNPLCTPVSYLFLCTSLFSLWVSAPLSSTVHSQSVYLICLLVYVHTAWLFPWVRCCLVSSVLQHFKRVFYLCLVVACSRESKDHNLDIDCRSSYEDQSVS